ncbi:hypothetical protein MICRO8M_110126 [Microbacterium sp. 8M]|nr:hypothetical protein MICRO8M_110126 [Microbacterium sp. 8M]
MSLEELWCYHGHCAEDQTEANRWKHSVHHLDGHSRCFEQERNLAAGRWIRDDARRDSFAPIPIKSANLLKLSRQSPRHPSATSLAFFRKGRLAVGKE